MSPSSSGATDPRKRRNIIIGAAVAVAVVAAVVVVLVSSGGSGSDTAGGSSSKQPSVRGAKEVAAMLDGIPQEGAVLGKKNAKVTVLEFIDYQCPVCREFALNNLPVIVRDYVRPGKVRMELRPLTFLDGKLKVDDSITAARAAAAAGEQNLEWNFSDLFYYNQGAEGSDYVTDQFIDSLYEAAGVDTTKANAFRKTDSAAVPARAADAEALKYGVGGTPSFVAGPTGGPYTLLPVAPLDLDGLKAALDALLKQ